MKKRIIIKGLSDYIRRIVALKPIDSGFELYANSLVYRGLTDSSYPLTPSLGRSVSPYWANTIQTKEQEQINQAQQRFPNLFLNPDWPAISLAKLQHYGIPTRMMDVTSNALVALYFACQNSKRNEKANGSVIVISGYVFSGYNPFVNAIADTARLAGNTVGKYTNFYYKVTKQPYFSGEVYPDEEFERRADLFRECTTKPFIVDVGDVSTRQINQQGKFILFPNEPMFCESDRKWRTQEKLITFDRNNKSVIKEIIIPNGIKERLLKELECIGITDQFLFADDVDLVCKRIVEKQKELYFRNR